ncbi:MAG: YqgE/AlgH family protein [Alphaproteobacteria bacterium]|nr:YqgE/AlgH family protein [Alphaproteobacteria bacterium]
MSDTPTDIRLAGRFLIAMPGMGDSRFDRSVIYMLAHDDDGAMGFTVNHPTDGLTLGEIASNLPDSVSQTGLRNLPVFVGGPVQPESGFVLHSVDPDDVTEGQKNEGQVAVTQSLDILVQAAGGKGPEYMRLVLGYAGWGPGQLENEIQENAWLIIEADVKDVFDVDVEGLYKRLIARLGIDLAKLSQSGGEA